MAQSKWERLAAGTGLVFVVLVVVAGVVNPVVDALADEASVVAEKLDDNQARALVSVAAGTLAALALVWFAGSLRSTLRQAEGGTGRLSAVAFAGGVMAGVTILVSSALTRTAAEFVRRQDDSEGARLAASLAESTMGVATAFAMALLMGATFVIALRHRAIPRWLAWVGAVGAALSLVPQYPIFGFGLAIALFWVAALSIVLIRRVGSTVES
ncbi:MAG: DUF4386 family protein [Acidimicrobiia bacterium]